MSSLIKKENPLLTKPWNTLKEKQHAPTGLLENKEVGTKKKKQGKTSSAVVQQTATALRSISRILLEATRTP